MDKQSYNAEDYRRGFNNGYKEGIEKGIELGFKAFIDATDRIYESMLRKKSDNEILKTLNIREEMGKIDAEQNDA